MGICYGVRAQNFAPVVVSGAKVMRISQLLNILNSKQIGGDAEFSGVSIDTRTIKKGDLYIAIKGERFDGHDFCQQAEKNGAAAIVVTAVQDISVPQIVVKDTRQALMDISQYHRDQMHIPVVGITGSCGKTTVRALVESILSQNAKVLASVRSYNNDIGVPLTLLQLQSSDQYAVIEMGANHAGEIAQLTKLVKPTVAILTCAAKAHLEGFGSLEGVSHAKGEVFQGLPYDGVAIINEDDHFAAYWKGIANKNRIITFGLSNAADVRAVDIGFDFVGYPNFTLQTEVGDIDVTLPLMGLHNVKNALAAAAAVMALNISLKQIKQGLEAVAPVSGRLVAEKGWNGAMIIDDSYNANPTSVAAAIDILANQSGESILVLGDMLEMGSAAESIHYELGELAQQKGLKHLYCFGPLTQQTVQGFGAGAKHFDSHDDLINMLKTDLSDTTTVLVKGSNSMGMSKVVQALKC